MTYGLYRIKAGCYPTQHRLAGAKNFWAGSELVKVLYPPYHRYYIDYSYVNPMYSHADRRHFFQKVLREYAYLREPSLWI